MAADKKIIPCRQQHMNIGLQSHPAQKSREELLRLGWILGKKLLELIDDDQNLVVLLTPTRNQRDRHVGLVKAQKVLHDLGVAGELVDQGLAKCCERPVPRYRNHRSPAGRA